MQRNERLILGAILWIIILLLTQICSNLFFSVFAFFWGMILCYFLMSLKDNHERPFSKEKKEVPTGSEAHEQTLATIHKFIFEPKQIDFSALQPILETIITAIEPISLVIKQKEKVLANARWTCVWYKKLFYQKPKDYLQRIMGFMQREFMTEEELTAQELSIRMFINNFDRIRREGE